MKHKTLSNWFFVLGSILVALIVTAPTSEAKTEIQISAGLQGQTPFAKGQEETSAASQFIRVTGAKNVSAPAYKENMASLGGRIIVAVADLQRLLDEATTKNQKIVLFLDGMPIKGANPEVVDKSNNTLRFHLKRTEESRAAWDALLGRPKSFTRPVSVSVGFENESALATDVDDNKKFTLIVINKYGLLGWVIFLVSSVVLLIKLARESAIIKNYGPESPYSLALTQMAVWFFLVISAYIFIWLITGVNASINGSILALLGIGAGTALGARIVDDNKLTSQLRKLLAGKEDLANQLNTAATTATPPLNMDEIKKNYTKVLQQIEIVESTKTATKSTGFLNDILNDVNGISFHRFQILAWTIVLGIIFCISVYRDLAMPEFSETLLALIGISSGTYLGFKFPEQHS